MDVPLTHRIWKIGSIALMLIISTQLTLSGFMKPRVQLTDHSALEEEHMQPGRKVIYMLFDALREDFVDWPEDQKLNLEQTYTGEKLKLFKELAEREPENTVFLPLYSEMPTVTIVRIKGFLSGILSTVFEFTQSLN